MVKYLLCLLIIPNAYASSKTTFSVPEPHPIEQLETLTADDSPQSFENNSHALLKFVQNNPAAGNQERNALINAITERLFIVEHEKSDLREPDLFDYRTGLEYIQHLFDATAAVQVILHSCAYAQAYNNEQCLVEDYLIRSAVLTCTCLLFRLSHYNGDTEMNALRTARLNYRAIIALLRKQQQNNPAEIS